MVPTKNSPADSEKPGTEKTSKAATRKAPTASTASKKKTSAAGAKKTADSKAPTQAQAKKSPAQKAPAVPTAQSPTQLIFAGPDPELFKKFAAEPDGHAPEKIVRKRQRQKPSTQDGGTQPTRTQKPKETQTSEPQRVKGSTRLEAKRQRRRDGRDQGRRKTVVTESEFLARRESVDRVMVVREKDDKTQIAVLEDGVVVEHYVAKSDEASLIGNVYLGRVQNVLPSMEAAFVDIGRGRNAVL